ncbi:hypothetical protein D9758_018433 [Tetrapyrgos nigripes]|uniref:Xylanolytic transcriptional activator regulatory domain-containing protein n=1 Tax=Tetrapyrgos nigripes TaxID=182062 RepID=A0A8H5C5N4_9AGAR|nr:hypothetical protein D9758_018433 [Tetrapyrgos nigripes]
MNLITHGILFMTFFHLAGRLRPGCWAHTARVFESSNIRHKVMNITPNIPVMKIFQPCEVFRMEFDLQLIQRHGEAPGKGEGFGTKQTSPSDPETMLVLSGMKWFQQLPIKQFAFGQDVSLYHLQMYCIALFYLENVGTGPDIGWAMTGIVIRLAQERGAHRRFMLESKSVVEREQWNHVFWILIFFDSRMSMVFGRPVHH